MGCDIHMLIEADKWHDYHQGHEPYWQPFTVCCWSCDGSKADCWDCRGSGVATWSGRNYAVFAVLAGVRNYWDIVPIAEPRGLPQNCTGNKELFDDHSFSWVSLAELLQYPWDDRVAESRTVRELVGVAWFNFMTQLKRLGDPRSVRLVFGFDN